MKQIIFTLFFLSAITLISCRKNSVQPDIKQYDDTQIQNYIKANGITGMTKAADTTGIYYKIILPGAGVPMDYPDKVSFVFSLRSVDGKYTSLDTINNHYDSFVGHVVNDNLPLGLQTAIRDILKYHGVSARLLIPSHLAYGVNGFGSGSSTNANSKIAGNQCLDYYVHIMGTTATDNQSTYDDMVIQNYMKANSLTGYTKTADSLYYKIITPATGTNFITINSTIGYTATGQLFNGVIVDDENGNGAGINVNVDGVIDGVKEGLIGNAAVGTKISLLIPSRLAYGEVGRSTIPVNSCLRFSFIISSVTP